MRYMIIGLGTYGRELSINLALHGNEVIGVDNQESNIEAIKDKLSTVYQLDSCDENALKMLPLRNMDVIIVAIGEDFGASLRTVALLKKMGLKHIYARAIDNLHESVLEAFNLDRILAPEKRAAKDLTFELAFAANCTSFNISDDYIILKMRVPERFVDHSYRSMNLSRFGLVLLSAVRKVTEKNVLGLPSRKEEILDLERRTMEEKILLNDEIVLMGSRKNFTDFLLSVKE